MQLPENVRPYVEAFVKHHFWLLAILVPLIVLPAVVTATADIDRKISAAQGQIDAKLSSLQSVQKNAEHPNEKWAELLRQDAVRIKRDTLRQWERFWAEQAALRVWPRTLGDDFIEKASRLQPGGRLPRSLLERYHEGVRRIVRTLPGRMGAANEMPEASPEESGPPADVGRPNRANAARAIVRWDATDQKRVYDSFDWRTPPSTLQVQLAQEEIWLYEMLCDTIASMNAKATGAFDAVVTAVEELAVGYPAAEDSPGGVGQGRVKRVGGPKSAGGGGEQFGGPPTEAPAEGQASRPAHPRFRGGTAVAARPGEPSAEEGAAARAPAADDQLRNWIYVDFDGKPLMASDLEASIANRMIHLVPFRLRVVMDQRRLDELLAKLAGSTIPVDVRQVRLNHKASIADPAPGGPLGQPAGQAAEGGGKRPLDVTVELRGSIAVATLPDRKAILGDAAVESDGEGPRQPEEGSSGQSEPGPPSAGVDP